MWLQCRIADTGAKQGNLLDHGEHLKAESYYLNSFESDPPCTIVIIQHSPWLLNTHRHGKHLLQWKCAQAQLTAHQAHAFL